ncbi:MULTISPECIES: formate/nitrite transporter family protein [Pontibacillus]|uniref:Formate/nitrite transporter family protein n=1 Tax=Pontibacillus chungwhensis TaxID=265426 RepID=A0ABY8UST3_9BACI|nr:MULTISPECIES: formate/nitrite transporter family protein [Pontibacillus]MCD5322871.1 formate/nitrite transporter family protein [Pontibacillus sp. HN14]WIF96268.1 formate/nitrite transporter family protein [Pontibacillus chungwhensis]
MSEDKQVNDEAQTDEEQEDKNIGTTIESRTNPDRPGRQFYIPSQIVSEFAQKGKDHLSKPFRSQFILALTAGSFMTFGALFSILLAIEVEVKGFYHLLSGFGFAAGYAMVFISGSVLFTEVNVLLPTYVFNAMEKQKNILKFWLSAYIGNIIGALFVAVLIQLSSSLSDSFYTELSMYLDKKMKFLDHGWVGWFQIIVSGILANWLIGMAAFLTTSARDLTGKILGTTLPVVLFVAGNFQHSAANMGYFSMGILASDQYEWYEFLFLNLIPASIGNIIGGAIFVSLIFSYAYKDDIQTALNKKD